MGGGATTQGDARARLRSLWGALEHIAAGEEEVISRGLHFIRGHPHYLEAAQVREQAGPHTRGALLFVRTKNDSPVAVRPTPKVEKKHLRIHFQHFCGSHLSLYLSFYWKLCAKSQIICSLPPRHTHTELPRSQTLLQYEKWHKQKKAHEEMSSQTAVPGGGRP